MTRYETIHLELGKLTRRQAIAVWVPTAGISVLVAKGTLSGTWKLILVLIIVVLVPLLLHHVWRLVLPNHRAWSDRSSDVRDEISNLQSQVASVFEKYRERRKGEHFKNAYDLNGRQIRDLEEALSVGMYRERREVFVTAFIRRGTAVRVTASIGSPFRCSAADNPAKWKEYVERLGCDEIRQYHNHPDHSGRTQPSPMDIKTSQSLKRVLGQHGAKLRSLIICWNGLREWKVFEHDEVGDHWLHHEFDVAAAPWNAADG